MYVKNIMYCIANPYISLINLFKMFEGKYLIILKHLTLPLYLLLPTAQPIVSVAVEFLKC